MTDLPRPDHLVPPLVAGPSRSLGAAPSRADEDAEEPDLAHAATLEMLARALPPSLVRFLR